MSDPAIIIHGGAGRVSDEHLKLKLPVLEKIINKAWKRLESNTSGKDILCFVLKSLEESEYFNAGYGGYPNEENKIKLDIGVAYGDSTYASLVDISRVKYPSELIFEFLKKEKDFFRVWNSKLEKEILEKGQEFLNKIAYVDEEEMIAPFVKKITEGKAKAFEFEVKNSGGTIGCVIRDSNGKIFSGTSTGGSYAKRIGRVGDSPIYGLGVYANDKIAGLSATGHGESIIKSQVTSHLVTEMRNVQREDREAFLKEPEKLKLLLEKELEEHHQMTQATCGIILIPAKGDPAYAVNKERMSLALRTVQTQKCFAVEA